MPMRFAPLLVLFLMLFPGTAFSDDDADRARDAMRAGRVLPLAEIAPRVQRQVPGEIIEISLDDDDDGPQYEIRMLTRDGRIVELEVDARTGRILDIDEDD